MHVDFSCLNFRYVPYNYFGAHACYIIIHRSRKVRQISNKVKSVGTHKSRKCMQSNARLLPIFRMGLYLSTDHEYELTTQDV